MIFERKSISIKTYPYNLMKIIFKSKPINMGHYRWQNFGHGCIIYFLPFVVVPKYSQYLYNLKTINSRIAILYYFTYSVER